MSVKCLVAIVVLALGSPRAHATQNETILWQTGGPLTAVLHDRERGREFIAEGGKVAIIAVDSLGERVAKGTVGNVPAPIYDLCVRGDVLLIAHAEGVLIVNVADGKEPEVVSRIKTGDAVTGLAANNTTAVALVGKWFGFYSIAFDYENNALGQYVRLPVSGFSIVTHDDDFVIAAGESGVVIVRAHNAAEAEIVRKINVGQPVSSIASSDAILYVGDTNGRVKCVDISAIDDTGEPLSEFVGGSVRHIVTTPRGMVVATENVVYSVERPCQEDHSRRRISGIESVIDLDGKGNSILVAHGAGVAEITIDCEIDVRTIYTSWLRAEDVEGDQRRIYVAAGESGVAVIGLSEQGSPTTVATLPFTGGVSRVRILGTRVVVGTISGRLGIIEAQGDGLIELSSMQLLPPGDIADVTYPDLGFQGVRDIDTDGRFLYIAAGRRGIFVIDAIDPYGPVVVSHFAMEGWSAAKIALRGHRAYVSHEPGSDDRRISVLDVSDPSNLNVVSTLLYAPPGIGRYPLIIDHDVLYIVSSAPASGNLWATWARQPAHRTELLGPPPPPLDQFLRTFDVRDPDAIVEMRPTVPQESVGLPRDAALIDGRLCMVSTAGAIHRRNELICVPVGSAASIGKPKSISLPGVALGIASIHGALLVALDEGGIALVGSNEGPIDVSPSPNLGLVPAAAVTSDNLGACKIHLPAAYRAN